MTPRLWWCTVLSFLALATSSSCNCGDARIVTSLDGGNLYARSAPTSGFTAGTLVSKSQRFRLVGEVNAPAGTSSRSQNFQLKGGVIAASQQ